MWSITRDTPALHESKKWVRVVQIDGFSCEAFGSGSFVNLINCLYPYMYGHITVFHFHVLIPSLLISTNGASELFPDFWLIAR